MTIETKLEASEPTTATPNSYSMTVKDFTDGGEVLGKGSYATVIEVMFRNKKAALKISDDRKNAHKTAKDEKEIMRQLTDLHKPYVVQLLGFMLCENRYLIAMEYMPNGSIEDFIDCNEEPLPLSLRLQWIKKIAEGLIFLHENHVVHRDLKGANILLDKDMNPKIGDFGSAAIMTDKPLQGMVGTPLWMAPEVILRESYNEKVDIYSLAITLLQIVSWSLPESDKTLHQFLVGVTQGERLELPKNLPHKLGKLITKAWDQRPDDRPSAKEILAKLEANTDDILSDSRLTP
ncbi:protein kinase domain-containing protein [Legionella brunensis]|uniref:Serine/threonine protein kinase n=1 Tax=Legionella brunensis TaxID=29422 RepID=A0A0W0SLR4_9GAMM|nr:protein kinase [Legionella brunensis]KTC84209.1 serine/threonine protein kinase [Legionella brunensis]